MARYAFDFEASGDALDLCERVVDRMVELFGIPVAEALGRVNRKWAGRDLDDSLICHEDQDYWANNIYYGHDSFWWLKPPGLAPLPYP